MASMGEVIHVSGNEVAVGIRSSPSEAAAVQFFTEDFLRKLKMLERIV